MPKSLSTTVTQDKNQLGSSDPWLILLDVTLPDATKLHLARNNEDVYLPQSAGVATFTGTPSYTAGKFGLASAVTASQTLVAPSSIISSTAGTIEIWVNITTATKTLTPGVFPTVFNLHAADGIKNAFVLYHEDASSNWSLRVQDATHSQNITIPDSYTPNGWCHFGVTWNASLVTLYINGVARGTISGPFLSATLFPWLYIGGYGVNIHQIGTQLDDLRITDQPRTADQMIATYNSTKSAKLDSENTYKLKFDGDLNIYRGLKYTAANFDFDASDENAKGNLPQVSLRINDQNQTLEDTLNAQNGAIGSTVLIKVISAALLEENYATIEVALEVLATANKAGVITFTLGIASPFRKRFPLLKTRGDFCSWVRWYKGAECKYSGALPTCKGTLDDCRAHNNSANFGGQPGLGRGGLRIA